VLRNGAGGDLGETSELEVRILAASFRDRIGDSLRRSQRLGAQARRNTAGGHRDGTGDFPRQANGVSPDVEFCEIMHPATINARL